MNTIFIVIKNIEHEGASVIGAYNSMKVATEIAMKETSNTKEYNEFGVMMHECEINGQVINKYFADGSYCPY